MTLSEVRFVGHLTASMVDTQLALVPRDAPLLLDCTEMTDYDSDARRRFEAWAARRPHDAALAVVTARPHWQLIVTTIGLAARTRMRGFATRGDAQRWLQTSSPAAASAAPEPARAFEVLQLGTFVAAVWRAQPTLTDLHYFDEALSQARAANTRGGTLTILAPFEGKKVGDRERAQATAMAGRHDASTIAAATVVIGSGVRLSMFRLLAQTLTLGTRAPHQVFGELEAALSFLADNRAINDDQRARARALVDAAGPPSTR